MDRIQQKNEGKRSHPMTSLTFYRASLFVFALALVAVDASMMHGQLGSDQMENEETSDTFENTVRQMNHVIKSKLPIDDDSSAGESRVSQTSSAYANKTDRKLKSIPGTEPKRIAPFNTSPVLNQTMSSKEAAAQNMTKFNSGPTSKVTPASHSEVRRGLTRDGIDPTQRNTGLPGKQSSAPMVVTPSDRSFPTPMHGAMIGAASRETNVERIFRLETTKSDLERENEELRQIITGLNTRNRDMQDQLVNIGREIQSARKELISSVNEVNRMRSDLQNLREKFRSAQKEHSDILQSMGPLLQQLLESDDVSSLPTNPRE